MAAPSFSDEPESNQSGAQRLPYALKGFESPGLGVRHVISHRESGLPLIAPSLYEVHLASSTDSYNSRIGALRPLLYLCTWALERNQGVERALLTGEGLSIAQVRAFAAWTKKRWVTPAGILPREHRRTYNAIIDGCSRACRWFVEQYALADMPHPGRAIQVMALVESQKSAWRRSRVKVNDKPEAEDLTDEEIERVECFLKPQSRSSDVGESKAVRDYLIWRLAIEFGMRRGEMLSLRTSDCPSRASPYFQIVRIEERGGNWVDPRGVHAPRPKTLSRDLSPIMQNTRFPKLSSEYITAHRFAAVNSERKRRQFLLGHDLLLVSESGRPLSSSYLGSLAAEIREATGVPFHWHLARHSFFNRAYAAIAAIEDREERQIKLNDLIYWGGWADPNSINIYVRAARKERARKNLMRWQEQGSPWTALD